MGEKTKEQTKQQRLPRLLIGATGSGSGKTTVTCGLLQAFLNRGLKPVSFKCGPDYIDPLFHSEVLGIPSRNLDLFFADENTVRSLLCKNARASSLAVIEGVMGYYDGLGTTATKASSYELAKVTKTPTVLLLDCKGKSLSILAEIKGFLDFRKDSQIQGVLLNRISPMLYADLKPLIEEELGIGVYGYLPVMKDCALESRHLGLVTAQELGNLQEILSKLAQQMEQSVDLDGLIGLAGRACPVCYEPLCYESVGAGKATPVRIAVARDKAFCFYYEDNLDLLRELGAQLVPFSPLVDAHLPEGIQGMILGGGYPELYLKELAANQSLREEIRAAVLKGLPCLGECGGFMYLHERILDQEEQAFPMVGVIEGESFPTKKLGRFGYITLTAKEDTLLCKKGDRICGHEFHYWDSTHQGEAFCGKKPLRTTQWDCIVSRGKLFAGYPHLYFYSNPQAAKAFIESCALYEG